MEKTIFLSQNRKKINKRVKQLRYCDIKNSLMEATYTGNAKKIAKNIFLSSVMTENRTIRV